MEGTNPPSNNDNEDNRINASSGDTIFPPFFRRSPLFGPLFALRDISSGIRNNERVKFPPIASKERIRYFFASPNSLISASNME